MAIAKGFSGDATFKKYVGYDQFNVLGINPNLETLHTWGVNMKQEPVYFDVDDSGIKRCRIHVWIKSKTFPDFITRIEYILRNARNEYSQDGRTVCQMIDPCGNVEWLTAEEVKNKVVPRNQKGKKKPFIPGDIRPCRKGESELTEFVRAFVNVRNSHSYNKDTGEWTVIDNAEEAAACRLERIADYFNGDFSELQEQMNNNTVQVLCGVRSGKDGRMYQETYSGLVLRKNANQAERIFKDDVARRKSKGGFKDTEFEIVKIRVWGVEASTEQEIAEATKTDDQQFS